MSMYSYTKLHSGLLESSVWVGTPYAHRIAWTALLTMADSLGRVSCAVQGLANRASITRAEAQAALDSFMSPDPDSRTPDFEGRRIEKIEGGYRLLNHAKYREQQDDEYQRSQDAKRAKAYRDRKKAKGQEGNDVTDNHAPSRAVTNNHPIASASASASAKSKLASFPPSALALPTANSQRAEPAPPLRENAKPASELASEPTPSSANPPMEYAEFISSLATMVGRLTGYDQQDVELRPRELDRLALLQAEPNLEPILVWALADKYWSVHLLDDGGNQAMLTFIRTFETIKGQARTPRKKGAAKPNKAKAKTTVSVKVVPVEPKQFIHSPSGETVTTLSITEPSNGTVRVRHRDGRESIVTINELAIGELVTA